MIHDDLLRRLAAANPVRNERVSGAVRSSGARALLERIVAEPAPVVPGTRRPRRRVWVPVAAVLVGAGVFLGVQILPEGGRGASAAARVLLATADVAGQVEAASAEGSYRYLRTEVAETQTLTGEQGVWSALVDLVREVWVAPDGSGRQLQASVHLTFPSPGDRERWEAGGSPALANVVDEEYGPAGLPYFDPSELPTEPEDLEATLRASIRPSAGGADIQVFVQVADLLRLPDASPELRAALFEVAAGLPRVELVGDTTDEAGRTGTAVALRSTDLGAETRTELVFDVETADVLEIRTLILEPVAWTPADPPILFAYRVFLDAGFTDSTDERPA